MGLIEQPNIEDSGHPSVMETTGTSGRSQLSVSVTYKLWRNPADRTDPANLADLDDQTRAALDAVPPWPRPGWQIETDPLVYAIGVALSTEINVTAVLPRTSLPLADLALARLATG